MQYVVIIIIIIIIITIIITLIRFMAILGRKGRFSI